MSHSISDHDHGFKALLSRLAKATGGLTVGVHEAEGAEPHEAESTASRITVDKSGRSHLDGKYLSKEKAAAIHAKAAKEKGKKPPPTVIEVAAFHEFGTSRTPRRSFIADWADEKEAEHKAQLRKMAQAVVKGSVHSVDQGLERLGNLYVGEVQRRISQGIAPELKQKTVDSKGSSKPLIDTGQLRASIMFRIVGADDEGGE